MFGNIFNEDDVALSEAIEESRRLQISTNGNAPDSPRAQCQLAGINNQGATCYLNSLLQTLFFTPEFRGALFGLSERELGRLEDKDNPRLKVRVIPLQLKRLFLRLLLSNRQSISTVELTESFGWTNSEELQQHDVQELNRILFLAIEDSLAGTRGNNLIKELYHGKLVNQITCMQCGKISEREEDFLDLTVTVGGVDSLVDGFQQMFCDMEMMKGKNQYWCEVCRRLVDAKKGTKIRSLPPILTISLLRFSYNFRKMERYKETGKFTFPMSINMKEFLDEEMPSDVTEYELFSVVIHRGSAHGGHYHAYIRDVDNLGNWVKPESAALEVPRCASATGDIQYDSPVDLCHQILSRHPHRAMNINKLCVEICNQTGHSWNKLFKKRYGSINKFFQKYDDKFVLNLDSGFVSLRQDLPQKLEKNNNRTKSPTDHKSKRRDSSQSDDRDRRKDDERPSSPLPPEGYRWFNFDDSVISPIRAKDIEKQFSGKESAYMLFYRKKSLIRPEEAMGNPVYELSESLVNPILQENRELEMQRQEYECIINMVTLQVHFSPHYGYVDGALKNCGGDHAFTELTMDRRQTVQDLIVAVKEIGGHLVPKQLVLHRMRDLPAGFHLYDEITQDCSKELVQLSIDSDTKLFAWNGHKVKDKPIPVGASSEPVYLTIIHGNPAQFSRGFPRDMTFDDFRSCICDLTQVDFSTIVLKKIVGKNSAMHVQTLEDCTSTLEGLQFKDGDQIIVEDKMKNSISLAEKTAARQSQFFITVQNKCGQCLHDGSWPKTTVHVSKDMLLSTVKSCAMEKFGVNEVLDGGRLRVDHETLGLRVPLHEELTVGDANITNKSVVILEPGKAPEKHQITLTVSSGDPNIELPEMEITVDYNITVGRCLKHIIHKCHLRGDSWHLRKTNWCGEAADLLDDLDISLENSLVNDGDHILLKEGKLPPKGYFQLPIFLYSFEDSSQNSWIINSIASSIQALMSKILTTTSCASHKGLAPIGEVQISKDASLEELKQKILMLPQVLELYITTPDFIRIRLIENNRLTTILRVLHQSLRRQKVTSSSRIAIQVLDVEEQLSQYEIVLAVKERIADTRDYGPEKELIWNTSQSADSRCLRKSIAELLNIQADTIVMAKHFPQKFTWLPITEMSVSRSESHKGRKKSRLPKLPSLKQPPFHITDGDIIGVQSHRDNKYDFNTVEDDEGLEELKREAEEKRKMREERKNASNGTGSRKRKPEVPLKIKVDSFT
ncbi:ubiquitin carboxyl-terminal hydrolase 40-like [Gigantopelta aegis]|uniref:ubiquitin carboxyl-terminal hydrolase 40-like n=1 Tax=Gigantopelta aegis TaxID=1735272 RepID=UPI001B88DAFA|nr:ubiquitin carboxyl-terminal hydrolase 40-like [Gigantopelta aegis]